MGNYTLQKGPCNFPNLRISPWEVLFPFLFCSSSLSALLLPWCLLPFFFPPAARQLYPISTSLPPCLLRFLPRAEQSAARRGPRAAAAGALGRGFRRAWWAARLGCGAGGERQQALGGCGRERCAGRPAPGGAAPGGLLAAWRGVT
jgi:hypothetical protein